MTAFALDQSYRSVHPTRSPNRPIRSVRFKGITFLCSRGSPTNFTTSSKGELLPSIFLWNLVYFCLFLLAPTWIDRAYSSGTHSGHLHGTFWRFGVNILQVCQLHTGKPPVAGHLNLKFQHCPPPPRQHGLLQWKRDGGKSVPPGHD